MKAVFFDFDGTLTTNNNNVWKSIWKKYGLPVDENSYYRSLFNRFMTNQITHQQWCDLTCEEFRKVGFDYNSLMNIADEIKMIDGIEETLKKLKENGYHLFIISGNIMSVIERVLGDKIKYFDGIEANKLIFEESGLIQLLT